MDNTVPTLHTERLKLRGWHDEDLLEFAKLNADPQVMEYFPTTLNRNESDRFANRIRAHFVHYGFGLWAIEIAHVAPFVGFVGLSIPKFDAHFTPCVEIGWRLASAYWGCGYATEGARAALAFGFDQFDEIVSFTAPQNRASRRVMEKLGMSHDEAGDFDHPMLPASHPLQRHVLYRLTRSEWEAASTDTHPE